MKYNNKILDLTLIKCAFYIIPHNPKHDFPSNLIARGSSWAYCLPWSVCSKCLQFEKIKPAKEIQYHHSTSQTFHSFIIRYQRQVADVLTSSNIQVPQHHSPLELLLHLTLYVPKLIAREWRNQAGTLESVTGGDDTASFLDKLRSATSPSSFRSCWSSPLTRKNNILKI